MTAKRVFNTGRVELRVISRVREDLEAFLAELRDNSAVAHCIKEVEELEVVPVPAGITGFSIARNRSRQRMRS